MLFKTTSLIALLAMAVMVSARPSDITPRDIVCISGQTCTCAEVDGDSAGFCACHPSDTFCNLTQWCTIKNAIGTGCSGAN
ncbi:hypothetical protein B0H13DRAFT_2313027 [Mycena leptocephala]|nr:hypothetical protein B0H13DRAFT_2313027 [Mycena leptocephala]